VIGSFHLTPCPLSFEGEGERFFSKRGFAPLKLPIGGEKGFIPKGLCPFELPQTSY
jgi:hypothetical protein